MTDFQANAENEKEARLNQNRPTNPRPQEAQTRKAAFIHPFSDEDITLKLPLVENTSEAIASSTTASVGDLRRASPTDYKTWIEDYLAIPGHKVKISRFNMPDDILLIDNSADADQLKELPDRDKMERKVVIVRKEIQLSDEVLAKIVPLRFANFTDIQEFELDEIPICYANTMPEELEREYADCLRANSRRETLWLRDSSRELMIVLAKPARLEQS